MDKSNICPTLTQLSPSKGCVCVCVCVCVGTMPSELTSFRSPVYRSCCWLLGDDHRELRPSRRPTAQITHAAGCRRRIHSTVPTLRYVKTRCMTSNRITLPSLSPARAPILSALEKFGAATVSFFTGDAVRVLRALGRQAPESSLRATQRLKEWKIHG